MQPNGKDTIYVDVDDEITSIIDKLTGSKQKIVALVLPKRATVLQSVVNMKLLKRSADSANKNLVLITSESSLLPLAGAAGVHVAKNLQTKPEIPAELAGGGIDEIDEDEALTLDDEPSAEYTAENAGSRPVGELAGGAAAGAAGGKGIETLELDDDAAKPAAGAAAAAGAVGAAKPKKDKSTKIPNFSKFQKKIIFGVLALLVLIGLWYVCAVVLPKATIAISTDATDYNSSLTATLDTAADSVDTSDNSVPATSQQQQKTYTQQQSASGQQNNGSKANGSVKMDGGGCTGSFFETAPGPYDAGTGVSHGSQTYLTQEKASFTCVKTSSHSAEWLTSDINIVAQKPGTVYNVGDGTTFSVAKGVSATGSASGGTDNIVKVVSQSDIDAAKSHINTTDTSAIKSALAGQLRQNNLYPIEATFSTGTPNTSTSSNAGDQADSVTVTETVTYSMYGAQRSYLDQLIKNDIKQQIDPQTQTILNDGLDKASFSLTSSTDTTAKVGLQTTATVGPKLNIDNLKQQIKGKKSGYVKSLIGNQPGVTDVSVKLSPFWVGSVPGNTSKITITVGKSSASGNGS